MRSEAITDNIQPMARVFLAVILGNFFWGISNVLTKIGISAADPEILLTCRFLLASVILTVMMILEKERPHFKRPTFRSLLTIIFVEPLLYISESYGLLFASATFAGVVGSLSPIAGTIVAALALGEYPSRQKFFYSIFPILGAIMITLNGSHIG